MPVCLCGEYCYVVQEHGQFKEQLICQAKPSETLAVVYFSFLSPAGNFKHDCSAANDVVAP